MELASNGSAGAQMGRTGLWHDKRKQSSGWSTAMGCLRVQRFNQWSQEGWPSSQCLGLRWAGQDRAATKHLLAGDYILGTAPIALHAPHGAARFHIGGPLWRQGSLVCALATRRKRNGMAGASNPNHTHPPRLQYGSTCTAKSSRGSERIRGQAANRGWK